MPENLDLVRSIYADWERGDFTRADWAHPEIEFVIADGVERGVWNGLGGMASYVRNVFGNMEDWRNEAEEYRQLAEERVLVLDRFTARGRSSGADVEAAVARVFEVRDGKVVKLTVYSERGRALADLGLEE